MYVQALTNYEAYDPSLNGLNGRFAQINLKADTSVYLRVRVYPSCSTTVSCAECDQKPTQAETDACYAAGCSCFAEVCTVASCCTGSSRETKRQQYTCPNMLRTVVLPTTSLIGLTVYDFDSGPAGEYREKLTIPNYAYYVTPLTPSSGNAITSSVAVDPVSHTFLSTAAGSSANNPSDPQDLTDEQARNGVQFYFRPENGYVDAQFEVIYIGAGVGTGRSLLFAGDSALCTPPQTPRPRTRLPDERKTALHFWLARL